LCAGVLAYFLSDAITRPIEQFREAAEAIRGGDFSRPLPLRAVDEIGELARSFQAMAADVQNTQQNLAGLVRERTTELERSHEQLRQSEKMSAVGQLAAGVAHEINNPVGIILGFAQSMVKKMPEADPLTHALKSIEREAIRARDLVQNLMTFSRQSKGAFEQMDFNAVVAQTLSIVEAKARVKSVEVVRELGSIEPLWGDKSRLQQVIVNLCGNALDAMPGGGKMTVRTKGAASGTEKQVVLEVEDTGAGIPKEIQDKIFEPFFTTKEVGQGAGLGLSFVYEIVQAHKGTIRVDSEAGKGAKFTIALPIRPPQTAAGPAARMPSARGQS